MSEIASVIELLSRDVVQSVLCVLDSLKDRKVKLMIIGLDNIELLMLGPKIVVIYCLLG